jgi:amino acid adenylation domain-containing protein
VLARGGTVVVVPDEVRADAPALCAFLAEARIESAYVPGFALAALTQAAEQGALPHLRRVLVGVEPIASQMVQRLLEAAPELTVVNGYGPTEASICATLHTAVRGKSAHDVLPLGIPVAGADVWLADRRGCRVPARVPGRVMVSGVGLALAYLGGSADDAARFQRDETSENSRRYDTGDIAYAEADGTLVYLGRADAQFKVQGLRVEAEEVEAVLLRQPNVGDAAVCVAGDGDQKRLVALIVLASPGGPSDASAALTSIIDGARSLLPAPLVPTELHVVLSLPRDRSGKLRRALLSSLIPSRADSEPPGPETDPRALLLLQITTKLLGRRPRLDESFFAAGGNSLLAAQLVTRLRNVLGADVRLRHVFEARSLRDLLAHMGGTAPLPARQIPLTPSFQQSARASFAQERLAFIDRLRPLDPVYNLACAAELRGSLDETRLLRSVSDVFARHEALRTVFRDDQGTLLQIVRPDLPLAFERLAVPGRDAALAQARAAARSPFDLSQGPLFRAHLFAFGKDEWLFCLTMHHIAADGWSLDILLREIAQAYQDPIKLPPVGTRPIDVAMAERAGLDGERLSKLTAHWQERLRDLPDALPLYRDRPHPQEQSFRGGHLLRRLPADTASMVRRCAVALDATPAMVYLAALDAMLMAMSGTSDIPVGVSLANRGTLDREGMVGFLVNVVVVRADVPEDASFGALVAQVRERSIEAYEHQELPFDRVAAALGKGRALGHAPLFQVNFVYDEARPMPALNELTLAPVHVETSTARFDLAFALMPAPEGVALTVEYNSDILEPETAAHMATLFEHVLASGVRAPTQPLAALFRDAPGARSEVSAPPKTKALFSSLFAQSCRTHAQRDALRQGDTRLSYERLDAAVTRVAAMLAARGVGHRSVVVLHLPRSIAAVVSILALWRLRAAYSPIDPDTPLARVAQQLEDVRPALVISTEDAEGNLPASWPEALLIGAGELPIAGDADNAENAARETVGPHSPETAAAADDLAYVIYTSGSTGKPNGVCVPQRGLGNLAAAQADTFGITHESVVLQFASLSFDASVSELVTALSSGATLYLGHDHDRTRVADDLKACTVATLPPSLLAALEPSQYPALQTLVSAGEALPAAVARRWLHAGKRLVNAYGPTEGTVCASMGLVRDAEGIIRIGSVMPGVAITVCNDAGEPLPRGMVGELLLGGLGLAVGYLRRPEITEQRFVHRSGERWFRTGDRARVTLQGELEFLGRKDLQLKVRGHRIEAEEVEDALRSLHTVRDAAVFAAGAPNGPDELVAHVIVRDAATPADLRARLRGILPLHMVPDRVVLCSDLPRNTSGKVDRAGLRARHAAHEPSAARRPSELGPVAEPTAAESAIATCMATVLRMTSLSPDDNFFEAGGDSIASIRLVALCQRQGLHFGVRDVFLHQTPRKLAQLARYEPVPEAHDVAPEGEVPLLPLQRWFLNLRGFDHAHYTQVLELEGPGPWIPAAVAQAIDCVAEAHDALRLRFEPQGDSWRQWYASERHAIALDVLGEGNTEGYRLRCQEAARTLDLRQGPLGRVVLHGPWLFFAVHHLVSDAYSLRILLEDFALAYASARAGAPPGLPAKTASFKAYVAALLAPAVDLAVEHAVQRELQTARRLPEAEGLTQEFDLRGDATTQRVELPVPATQALLRVPMRLGCSIEAVLLSAWAFALEDALDPAPIVVDVEGHGRQQDPRRPMLDASRTVGFCTALCPILLRAVGTRDLESVALELAEQFARIPGAGTGLAALGWAGQGELAFNHLGDMGASGAMALGCRLRIPDVAAQAPAMPRPHKIEITTWTHDGKLHAGIAHNPKRHPQALVQQWAQRFERALELLAGAPAADASDATSQTGSGQASAADARPSEALHIDTSLDADTLAQVLDELGDDAEGSLP